MDDMTAAYYHPPPAADCYPYYSPPPVYAPASVHGAPPPPSYKRPLPHQAHFSPPYPLHQLPPYSAAYAAPSEDTSREEVRTLFIAGLPDDVKAREVYNLFWEFPGYKSAKIRKSGQSSQAYAFAVFTDQQSALAAMRTLNEHDKIEDHWQGLMFDLEKESTLHIDLAKSNSKSKRSRTDDDSVHSFDRRVRGSVAYSRGFPESGAGSNTHMPGIVKSAHSLNGYPSTQRQIKFGYDEHNDLKNSSTISAQSNPPCPTLFVANLGPNCSEQELNQVFSRCPGFLKLKMQNKKGVPVAFVDFQDVNSSTGALNHLQGTILYSSVGEGMRLEYAKSRMGLRKRE